MLKKALGKWGQTPYPLTVEQIIWVGAVLKEGNYRSASSYQGQYRADTERDGHDITDRCPGP